MSATILTGCANAADPDTELSSVTVVDGRLAFSLQIDQPGVGIETVRATGDTSPCPQVRYSLRNETSIEAVASNCTIPPNANRQIGNGRHGIYRTVEDVAHPIGLVQQQTKLGPAAVFSQEYYECTNSCKRWNEPIAIVTLSKPAKAEYPTLVVRLGRSDASMEDLTKLIGGLASASAQ
ncbi:hypothetical protein [Amycolatopsis benzoatilytica]|uniref:hypothetical protein n=1 Tax=Amycolatopsis benzoatilytica TaxID=346045 RepID=UPI00039DD59A|nr:hypothetical protein [Amycolatopsis benzoatilytica]